MATAKEIKQRIKSIKNTQKTTKAMELVSGAKMRKAVHAAVATRGYHSVAWSMSHRVRASEDFEMNEDLLRFFDAAAPAKDRKKMHVTLLLLTSNRGLCGAFNSNIVKAAAKTIAQYGKENVNVVTIGKKGVVMLNSLQVSAHLAYTKEDSAVNDDSIQEVAAYCYQQYRDKNTDVVLVAYTDYQSPIVQNPVVHQMYPLPKESETTVGMEKRQTPANIDYTHEPGPAEVLGFLVPRIAEVELYQALLESNASEHSARMLAMKNATDAAKEMGKELTLEFNRARQASITKEIAEIAAGTAAVS